MGVRQIKMLSEIPARLLEREFGKTGRRLWEKANAIDSTPVVPYSEKKSISKERTFMEDSLDIKMMRHKLMGMVDALAFELRNASKLTSCVTIKIRYADFNTYTKQRRIPYTANDRVLIDHTHELFDSLFERRQLIRLIGVKFSGLVHGNYQISLFDDSMKAISLMESRDRVRNRFGNNAIKYASTL